MRKLGESLGFLGVLGIGAWIVATGYGFPAASHVRVWLAWGLGSLAVAIIGSELAVRVPARGGATKRVLPLLFVTLPFLTGCGAGVPFEYLPLRNTDPRVGPCYNHGTTHLNLWILDALTGELAPFSIYDFEKLRWVHGVGGPIYIPPAEDPLSPLAVNQQRDPTRILMALDVGRYRVEYIPFYHTWSVLGGRYRVDLPRGATSISVGHDPNAAHEPEFGRHWGWILRLNGGDVPKGPLRQNINFSIRCC